MPYPGELACVHTHLESLKMDILDFESPCDMLNIAV